ncbi:MAG TPA: 1-acyl-sn-glycerol-3-phosphate acyltransferase [Ruminococcaceae bacterium]|nr:1-acyl-sn-glycerol-3-phosphate acyltransferase [Oscillospiraceae bacterium]
MLITVRAVLFFIFPMKIVGRENVPKTGGIVLCCNHISYMDPVYLSLAVKRPVFYMAKEELFNHRFLGWLLKSLGAFPVRRGAGGQSGIHTGEDIIKQGRIMGIFPEGTRSKDLTPQRAKSGVAMIAAQTGADVLPAAIAVKGKIRPFRRVTVRIGKIIPNGELAVKQGLPSEIKAAAGRIMEEIRALWEAGN